MEAKKPITIYDFFELIKHEFELGGADPIEFDTKFKMELARKCFVMANQFHCEQNEIGKKVLNITGIGITSPDIQ